MALETGPDINYEDPVRAVCGEVITADIFNLLVDAVRGLSAKQQSECSVGYTVNNGIKHVDFGWSYGTISLPGSAGETLLSPSFRKDIEISKDYTHYRLGVNVFPYQFTGLFGISVALVHMRRIKFILRGNAGNQTLLNLVMGPGIAAGIGETLIPTGTATNLAGTGPINAALLPISGSTILGDLTLEITLKIVYAGGSPWGAGKMITITAPNQYFGIERAHLSLYREII